MLTLRTSVLLTLLFICTATPVPALADFISHDHFDHTILKMELGLPGGAVEIVTFRGSAQTRTYFEGDEGDADDDDGNGLDELPAQFGALVLEGTSAHAGQLQLTLQAIPLTFGELEETVNNIPGQIEVPPYHAAGELDVSFNMYYTLELVDLFGTELHNNQPQPIMGRCHRLPFGPGDLLSSMQTTELYYETDEPSGWWCRVIYHYLHLNREFTDFQTVTAELELMDSTGQSLVVPLEGNAEIQSIFEGDVTGEASDDDQNGLDEIDTELRHFHLTGFSSSGIVILDYNSDEPSFGVIEESVNHNDWWLDLPPFTGTTNDPASSFFDVYFTLTVGTMLLRNDHPHPVGGIVTRHPSGPGDLLVSEEYVGLVDNSGQSTGWQARLNFLKLVPSASAVDEDPLPGPKGLHLSTMPNPFNPRVRICFRDEQAGQAVLQVFDPRGLKVATLYDGPVASQETVIYWDGRDDSGQAVASGSYFLRLETDAGLTKRKVLLVR